MRFLSSKYCARKNATFLYRPFLYIYTQPLTGRYDPNTKIITQNTPRDLKDFSPRSRIIAIHGENSLTDRLIEKAVDLNTQIIVPDECKLIALLSQEWENSLLRAISSAANKKGLILDDIDSVKATFSSNKFILNALRTTSGTEIRVNSPIYF